MKKALIINSITKEITTGKVYNVIKIEDEVIIHLIDNNGEKNYIVNGQDFEECIIFDNNIAVAKYLIDNIDGLADAVISLKNSIIK